MASNWESAASHLLVCGGGCLCIVPFAVPFAIILFFSHVAQHGLEGSAVIVVIRVHYVVQVVLRTLLLMQIECMQFTPQC